MSHETFNSGGLKVLIVEDDTLVGLGLKDHLERLGHVVVGHAATAEEAKRLFRANPPDLILVDIRLNGDDGITLAEALMEERRTPIIMISAYSDPELINRASSAGIFGYLVKPFSFETLVAQIEVAVKRFREREQLIQDRDAAIQNLETRKLVERAKGIFMKRLNLSEPEAHRRLQLESQRRRISLAELAKKVIESDELW